MSLPENDEMGHDSAMSDNTREVIPHGRRGWPLANDAPKTSEGHNFRTRTQFWKFIVVGKLSERRRQWFPYSRNSEKL
jgi:hypothetical protein